MTKKGETPESFIQVGWKDNKNRILIKVTQSRTGGNHSSRTLAQFVRFCFFGVFSARKMFASGKDNNYRVSRNCIKQS